MRDRRLISANGSSRTWFHSHGAQPRSSDADGLDPAAFSQFGQSFLVGRQQPAAGALGEGKPRSYWQDCAEFMLAVGAEQAHTFISSFHP